MHQKRNITNRDCDAGADKVRDTVHDAFKFWGAGNDLDRVEILLAELLLRLGSLAFEAVDILEILVAVLGRCLEDL